MISIPRPNQLELLAEGTKLIRRFCDKNGLTCPPIRHVQPQKWKFDACAYYRPTYIAISVKRCSRPGHGGASWSWPGYVIDRTPYGVLAHELGHHVDYTLSTEKAAYFGDYSRKLRQRTAEPRLTGYCPNDAGWFAEIFRLFVTNPDLLSKLRPETYNELRDRFTPATYAPWEEVLTHAPLRIVNQARKKIDEFNPRMSLKDLAVKFVEKHDGVLHQSEGHDQGGLLAGGGSVPVGEGSA